jgi:predicted nucleic acid-binding protein
VLGARSALADEGPPETMTLRLPRFFLASCEIPVKWYSPEERHANAKGLLDLAETIVAPELIVSEVTNAAWAKVRRGEISERVARLVVAWIGSGVPALVPAIELNEHALEIALSLRHPVDDCIYLACAEFEAVPLVTDDQRLLRAAGSGPWRGKVMALADVSPSD